MKHFYRNIFILSGAVISLFMMASCNSNSKTMEDHALLTEDLDTTVRPQDDFYQYATGGWQKNHPLPEEESRFGSFDQLGKETSQKVKDLIVELSEADNEEGSIEWKIGTFYAVGMDSAKAESLGIKPVLPEFDKIEALSSKEDVVKQFAYNNKNGLSSLFYFFGAADADNSEMEIAQVNQGGLGLPDRDYYTADDSRSIEIREEYVRFVTNMFALLGDNAETAEKKCKTYHGY